MSIVADPDGDPLESTLVIVQAEPAMGNTPRPPVDITDPPPSIPNEANNIFPENPVCT